MYIEEMFKAVLLVIGVWIASLVFLVAVSMHIVKYFHFGVNAWLVGGITAGVWAVISALWLYMVNVG